MTTAVLWALAVWWSVPPCHDRRLARVGAVSPRHRSGWPLPAAVAAGVAVLMLIVGGALTLLLALACAGPIATAGWVLRARLAARRRNRERQAVARACGIVASQLRAGRMPTSALALAAEECSVLADAAGLTAVGGDPASLWLDQAMEPGREGLGQVARAWSLSQMTGAPMAEALGAVAEALQQDAEVRRTVESELAAPLMTSRLLAVLPLAGIGIGYAIGGDPVAFLTGSVAGGVCLALGSALACAGVVWTERITARAAR